MPEETIVMPVITMSIPTTTSTTVDLDVCNMGADKLAFIEILASENAIVTVKANPNNGNMVPLALVDKRTPAKLEPAYLFNVLKANRLQVQVQSKDGSQAWASIVVWQYRKAVVPLSDYDRTVVCMSATGGSQPQVA